ncbi:MAG: pyrroline-5-carboxylate reductase [archaeon]
MVIIGFIGAGKMGEALIKGMIKAKVAESIYAFDPDRQKMDNLSSLGVMPTAGNCDLVSRSDIIIIAVKPQAMPGVLSEIKKTGDKLVVSIAAGIKISAIESELRQARVVRVMPNTPCLVGEMAAAYSCAARVEEADKSIIEGLFGCCGLIFCLNEEDLDAVTALSGSGPAFIAYFIKILAESATALGLDSTTSMELAIQTALGTARLLQETKLSPDELIKMVSSPGGTTVEGMKVLESSEAIIRNTVKAAHRRSVELSK